MFGEMLQHVLTQTPGAVAVTLMGFDGIAIDQQMADVPPEGQDPSSWNAAAIELGHIATQLKTISEGMGTGEVNEVAVRTGALTTVLRPLTPEYFVALSLAPGANVGKGRYLMRVLAPKLVKELV
mgnify:CR=1 FL=1